MDLGDNYYKKCSVFPILPPFPKKCPLLLIFIPTWQNPYKPCDGDLAQLVQIDLQCVGVPVDTNMQSRVKYVNLTTGLLGRVGKK